MEKQLAKALAASPAVVLQGARYVGKSTLARQFAASEFDMSNEVDVDSLELDPLGSLREAEKPVLVDEWQMLPQTLWTIKNLIDKEKASGFIIAGSTGYSEAHGFNQFPLTGRCDILQLRPMSQAERLGVSPVPFGDVLFGGTKEWGDTQSLEHESYLEAVLSSGYPGHISLNEQETRRALRRISRDVIEADIVRYQAKRDSAGTRSGLARFIAAYAGHSGRIVDLLSIAKLAGLNYKTAAKYRDLYDNSFLIEELPIWRPTADSQGFRHPKRLLRDSGLIAPLLGINKKQVLASSQLLGGIVETFVYAQLCAQQAVSEEPYEIECYNLTRSSNPNRHSSEYPLGEIDFVLKSTRRSVIGVVEVKARNRVKREDANRMIALRDAIVADGRTHWEFTTGVVLCCGNIKPTRISDRIWAAPMSVLWAT